MRFAENNRISHKQLYRQMILEFLAPFILCMYGAGNLNGINALIGMAMALISGVLCDRSYPHDTGV